MDLQEAQATSKKTSLALFCKVVDNFGDIGICWRLARQLEQEHDIAVTLWVDDLASFKRICPVVQVELEIQQVANITVRQWRDQDGIFTPADIADIVIEFFACNIPPAYIAAMANCQPRPAWLNLEGLTAEQWVEGCHTLPSPHPSYSLTKHFFFPGFNAKTGGLLREADLEQQRTSFQSDAVGMSAFLSSLGLSQADMTATKISLFCYPHAPVSSLFAAWENAGNPIVCLVPQGVAADAVETFLGQPATAGASASRGALTLRVLPFVPQQDYDKLLWACDFNFVRGEDSFVRAQWANKPFIWHIYPQDENLHHVKLKAFLQTYTPASPALTSLSHAWNGLNKEAEDWPELWQSIQAEMPEIERLCIRWQEKMLTIGDMTSNMLKFVSSARVASTKDTV